MNMIVAVDRQWGIGKDNGLLASLPGDMKYFKDKTLGKAVLMGRKTLESLPGQKGLPKRENFVMTSNENFEAERCEIIHDEQEVLDLIKKYGDDLFLIGGATMYNKYYKLCDKLYITKIDAILRADTFITNIDKDPNFKIISESEPIEENDLIYRFVVYKRG